MKPADGPDDLARYFREIHANALRTSLTRASATSTSPVWPPPAAVRVDAIRRAVAAVGAPKRPTEEATAMILSLSGADASWRMHDQHGLALARIPNVIAHTVQLVIDDLRARVTPPPREDHLANEVPVHSVA